MELITDVSLWELVKHLKQWLVNLRKAGDARKRESVEALRAVIVAARHTSVYVQRLNEPGQQDHAEEARLTAMWTGLSFMLADLKLFKLAKRCDIEGRYWANPAQFDAGFLEKADVGLDRMEQLARQMVAEIDR
jgi:hypothetical protein